VTEDVTDIILNLRQVVFNYDLDEPMWLSLTADSEGEVTAANFNLPPGVSIVNPDMHICTLGQGASINLQVYVVTGRGYVDRRLRRRGRRRHFDDGAADADLGERHFPFEAIEPAVRRDRQPAIRNHAIGGPHRVAGGPEAEHPEHPLSIPLFRNRFYIDTLYDLVTRSESEMLKFRNFGRKSLNEIGELLEGMGLRFGMSFEDDVVRLVKGEPAAK